MQAKDVMTKKAHFLPPTATISEAAEQMRQQDYGFIPVGENDRLIGAVTDRDICLRAVAKGKDPKKTTLKEILTENIRFCFETDDLKKVAQLMEKEKIRRLVVLNKDKRMTGIITLGDIAQKAKDAKLLSEVEVVITEH